MAGFIERHPKLTGLLAVCGTYLGGMIIHRKHVEKVNDQRLEWCRLYGGDTTDDLLHKAIINADEDICTNNKDDS